MWSVKDFIKQTSKQELNNMADPILITGQMPQTCWLS